MRRLKVGPGTDEIRNLVQRRTDRNGQSRDALLFNVMQKISDAL